MNTMALENLGHMNATEEKNFFSSFEKTISNDDGQAAKAHLAAGRAIYYCLDQFKDSVVREWPDGRRELVRVSAEGKPIILRVL